jgi:hypothetical protein
LAEKHDIKEGCSAEKLIELAEEYKIRLILNEKDA